MVDSRATELDEAMFEGGGKDRDEKRKGTEDWSTCGLVLRTECWV